MTQLVNPAEIEALVGTERHATKHYGRARSEDQTLYILHSHECRDSTPDLRECPYSIALDQGINLQYWYDAIDLTVELYLNTDGTLWPMKGKEGHG